VRKHRSLCGHMSLLCGSLFIISFLEGLRREISRSFAGLCCGYIHMCVCIHVYTCMHMYTCASGAVSIYIHMCVCIDIFICVCVYMYTRVCTCTHVHQALYQLFGSYSLCHYPLSSGTTSNFPHAYEHEIRTENTSTWTTSSFLHYINMICIWKQYHYMYACNCESTFTCKHTVSLHIRQIVPYIYSCNSCEYVSGAAPAVWTVAQGLLH